jgi:hypothetical protein
MSTFGQRVLAFNSRLDFKGKLPKGISIMNPFKNNKKITEITARFYNKFYIDNDERFLVLGINPGRHGAGVTGIPFTDTKRLNNECGIEFTDFVSHEPSSVFVYEVIKAYGGVEKFYSKYYITSLCPLGFTIKKSNGREVNYNYYDSKQLTAAVYDFIVDSIKKQIKIGVSKDVCYCFGTGKNAKFLIELNNKEKFFKKIVPLEHPRFIVQYRLKKMKQYIDKYLSLLK